jgi:hypothetical protein
MKIWFCLAASYLLIGWAAICERGPFSRFLSAFDPDVSATVTGIQRFTDSFHAPSWGATVASFHQSGALLLCTVGLIGVAMLYKGRITHRRVLARRGIQK